MLYDHYDDRSEATTWRTYIDQMEHWCKNWIITDNRAWIVQRVNDYLLTIDTNRKSEHELCITAFGQLTN
eukprot:3785892-Karenia_brevis.AAC.1